MLSASLLRQFGFDEHEIFINEPLAPRTWMKTGGSASLLVESKSYQKISILFSFCHDHNIPIFFLGDGSNLIVSDRGFPGVVVTTGSFVDEDIYWSAKDSKEFFLTIPSGRRVNDIVKMCCQKNLSGLEYFFGLPGTVGGAVFMNASCYDHAWSEVFIKAKVLYADGTMCWITKNNNEWGYKKSPFQKLGALILSVVIRLFTGCGNDELLKIADSHYKNRQEKGHFHAPCAGSIFKNNRTFEKPSGQIIESLGLKGFSLGGAQIAPWHANILINRDNATSQEIYDLTFYIQKKVRDSYGYNLEPEVVFLGDFTK